jgi:penicillin-binding protein 1A
MDSILIKIFALALALSQVGTRPENVKTSFDPGRDQREVTKVLRAGCAHMRKVFAIESIDVDDLIATAMDDPNGADGTAKVMHGLTVDDIVAAYRQFCKNETVARPAVDLGNVISSYNAVLADLPDHAALRDHPLAGIALLLDQKDRRFAEIGRPERRRVWVPLSDVPEHVWKAFVAAEDGRFFQHRGIDERGMIRAFLSNLGGSGRMQGGSTITQQVAKNLLVGDAATFDRKIREIVIASRIERTFSKSEILELYLNSIYFGRGAWGIEIAARNYFGKHAGELSLAEGAVLAGLVRGPSVYSPDRYPTRTQQRLGYVLDRMQEDGHITIDQKRQAQAQLPPFGEYQGYRRDIGFHFVDEVAREARTQAGIGALDDAPYVVHSTIVPELQRATEAALQEGLARYEARGGRQRFEGPEANLRESIRRIEQQRALNHEDGTPTAQQAAPAWQQALGSARLPLYDVQWPVGVVLPSTDGKRSGALRVGLKDGRVLPLVAGSSARRSLKAYDVVFVRVLGKDRSGGRAELRVRPSVQGAALVLENKTGKILAMSGGFSYPLSQLNRSMQTRRQPGSALKPVTYLAALKAGLQPNSVVLDEPITLAPPDGTTRPENYWTPRNDSGSTLGPITLRRALENSRNLATAHLLEGGIAKDPKDSLARVCEIAVTLRLYAQCEPFYPFVLGAQPLRVVDLAAFYASVANEGRRPSPHTIESIELNGQVVYRHQRALEQVKDIGPATFFQLRTMLEGVVSRGTARSIRGLARFVAGKTGTTTDVNDAWFVGFSNDVTVAVWVGYDNGDGQRRTLGDRQTGNGVAVPIFDEIMQAAWANLQPRTVLASPSAEARRRLVELPINPGSGARLGKGQKGFVEYLRLNQQGKIDEPRSARASANERQRRTRSESRRANSTQARTPSAQSSSAQSPSAQSSPAPSSAARTAARRPPQQPQQQPQQGWFGGWGGGGWGNGGNDAWGNRGGWGNPRPFWSDRY